MAKNTASLQARRERELWCAAAVHLVGAIREMDKIAKDQTMASEEAKYYAANLREMLSCDHGEAGINAIIDNLTKRVEG